MSARVAWLVTLLALVACGPTARTTSGTDAPTTESVVSTSITTAALTTETTLPAELVISHVPLDVGAVLQVVAAPDALWVLAAVGEIPVGAKPPPYPTDRVLLHVDPRTGQSTTRVPLPTTSQRIKTSGHALWVLAYSGSGNAGDNATVDTLIDRVDPQTGAVTEAARFAPYPPVLDFAATDDALWVIYEDGIRRVDPASHRTIVDITLPGSPSSVVIGPSGPWVLLGRETDFGVVDVNARTNELGTLIPIAGGGSAGMVYGNQSLWAEVDGLVRIDTTTRQATRPQPSKWDYQTTLVASNTHLWELTSAVVPGENTVTVLDITGEPRVIADRASIGPADWSPGWDATADGTGLWIPNQTELLHVHLAP